ncbi:MULTISPECIES: ABC transporter ATP-binding protein [Pseudonocardia]|uniref:ABC transporter n=2 Tax=Pseudonocardia TaxID=1847 RepID=A0ABQ0RX12_9PSEU|nr:MULTISPECIES: ABC transporter ATP-binding protein [Pseudonocardia]OSY40601.1 putative siderophore transport system ATP-binding protein YusV [Pseudonocardia autotrophica]TDN73602.1 iron complex transport system ATP-binding protein [Pseudonocardia autotrophica]BBG04346.1 ABC transporter [Pseudonocardia autotrophica]GEC25212.1 ABC transporter [Pseudonocardia saturnea]
MTSHAPDPGAPPACRLGTRDLEVGYDDRTVVRGLTLDIPDGGFTVIVGPNACGKSTLLKALARGLRPRGGSVLLDGTRIETHRSKEVARRLGLLPQTAQTPGGISVGDLVARGRYPHQRMLRQWTRGDEEAVLAALRATGTEALADRLVEELSGGQRQRVWIALALAQETPILLLDEPTTYLDVAHQLDVLDLCDDLRSSRGQTLVAVLHDLNHACRYATHLVAMRDGALVAQGPPGEVVTADLVEQVFGMRCRIIPDPETGTPLVVPADRRRRTAARQT